MYGIIAISIHYLSTKLICHILLRNIFGQQSGKLWECKISWMVFIKEMKGLKLAFLNSRLLAVHNESIPLFDSFVYSHHLLLDNIMNIVRRFRMLGTLVNSRHYTCLNRKLETILNFTFIHIAFFSLLLVCFKYQRSLKRCHSYMSNK